MTDEPLNQTPRQRLKELQEELLSLAATSEQSSQVVQLDQSRVGRLSRMDAMQAQAMSQASDRRREEMLRNISAALSRIDNGEYGICLLCEGEIHQKRLEFDPAATLCIACAEKAER